MQANDPYTENHLAQPRVRRLVHIVHALHPLSSNPRALVSVCAGYRVSSTHCTPLGVKTDAPASAIWDIMRCWAAQHPRKHPPEPDSYMGRMLAKPPVLQADFTRARVRTCKPCSDGPISLRQSVVIISKGA